MLTFSARDQSLRSILEQIADLTNVAVVIPVDLGNERISSQFQRYRLDEALRLILQDYDTLFFYSGLKNNDGVAALQTVWVYPPNQGPGMHGVRMPCSP